MAEAPEAVKTSSGMSRPMRATLMVIGAMVCFSVLAVLVRVAASRLPVLEVVFFRNFFALLYLLPVMVCRRRLLVSSHRSLHVLRAFLAYGAMYCTFTAVSLIPLSEATVLNFTMPLFATAGAVLLLGERIRVRRVLALTAGFAGVLLVLRPGAEAVSPGALLAITGSLLIALSTLLVKRLTVWDDPMTIALWMVVVLTPMSLAPALLVWQWPTPQDMLMLAAVGAVALGGHVLWIYALSVAEVSHLQPFEFLRLPMVALAAWLLFGESTTVWIWAGGGVIVLSSAYIAHREALAARGH